MNKIKFDTKKDWLGKTLLLGPPLLISTLTILNLIGVSFNPVISNATPLIIGSVGFWIFFLLAWNFTWYTINNRTLTARIALLRWRTIKIDDIQEIKSQEFGHFIFGLSKDVLSIKLKNGAELNISPNRPDDFIKEVEKRKDTTIN
ncbi:PH domain-containing protein [Cyclobacterium roseum]|uniref:PH domain-containing protein n=1 Tax=Cyclobacterium roseum TaxID=2666137 RepID=UPI0013917A3B|nr:PH domain-containing protein [Cyclobacterium roseum]